MKILKRSLAALSAAAVAAGVCGSVSASAASAKEMTMADIIKDMGVGINLGNTFESCGVETGIGSWTYKAAFETGWGSPKVTQEMIQGMADEGFGSVRIPVAWSNTFKKGDTTYTIDQDALDRVKEVAQWAVDADMYVIVNIHWDGGWWAKAFGTDKDEAMKRYTRMWEQIADEFKDFDQHLIFESLNEEGGSWEEYVSKDESYKILNEVNQTFTDLVRNSGGNNADRPLLIAGYNTDIVGLRAALDELLTPYLHQQLVDEIELLDGAAEEFDLDRVLRGELSPVFFGSALTNFGVEPFLENFLRLTPTPLARVDSLTGEAVDPCRDEFSAFIFKIQANMNKAHRDRIAFMRICSGKFERGMEAYHVQEGKNIKLATGTQLMAQDRAIVDEAYAGDIIGLFDPGIFSIGDTLCTGKKKVEFAGIPTFSPEHFARIEQKDTMKRKQFVKGMEQIAQEGAIQIFREVGGGMEEVVVGVVGVLQLEVLEYRLNTEYNVEIRMQQLPFEQLRWIQNDPDTYVLRDLDLTSDTKAVEDMKGNRLLLFTSDWAIRWAETHNETLKLSEFGNI